MIDEETQEFYANFIKKYGVTIEEGNCNCKNNNYRYFDGTIIICMFCYKKFKNIVEIKEIENE